MRRHHPDLCFNPHPFQPFDGWYQHWKITVATHNNCHFFTHIDPLSHAGAAFEAVMTQPNFRIVLRCEEHKTEFQVSFQLSFTSLPAGKEKRALHQQYARTDDQSQNQFGTSSNFT